MSLIMKSYPSIDRMIDRFVTIQTRIVRYGVGEKQLCNRPMETWSFSHENAEKSRFLLAENNRFDDMNHDKYSILNV